MKVRIVWSAFKDKDGNDVEYPVYVDEKGKQAKGMFTVKDGRPFDLIKNEYAD